MKGAPFASEGKNISLDTKGSTDKFSDSQDTPKREGYDGKYGELYIYERL